MAKEGEKGESEDKHDMWNVLDIILKGIGSILIPIAIFCLGRMVSSAERQSAETAQQTERVAALIGHLASKDAKERELAAEMMEYYAEHNQAPIELVGALTAVARKDDNPDVVLAASRALKVATRDAPEIAKDIQGEFSKLPPRVYIHVPRGDEFLQARQKANQIAQELANRGFFVSDIISVSPNLSPQANQVRFFKPGEQTEADGIVSILSQLGVQAKPEDKSRERENAEEFGRDIMNYG